MTRPAFALLLLLALAPASCSDPSSGPLEIRVRNESTVVMQDVVIGFPEDVGGGGGPVQPGDAESGDVSYGTVEPGAATSYRAIARAYRYARITTTVGGEELVLQPIDFVGESLLDPGRYTYELRIVSGSTLALTLVRD